MKKEMMGSLVLGLCLLGLTACGGSENYRDGTYTGKSDVYVNEEDGSEAGSGYGQVEVTIQGNKITACTYKSYQKDGTLKDENYGKDTDGQVAMRDWYNKAQKAVAACDKYAEELVYTGDIDQVDVISGATINHDNFVDAVNKALDQAKAE